jgi:hypothetical protein
MKVSRSIRIERPVDKVWNRVNDVFAKISLWAGALKKSVELTDVDKREGAPSAGRDCELSDKSDGLCARSRCRGPTRGGPTGTPRPS